MNVNQSPLTVGNKQNMFMPIGSPAPSDTKWKHSSNNTPSPIPYAPPPPQVIRPELVRPPPQIQLQQHQLHQHQSQQQQQQQQHLQQHLSHHSLPPPQLHSSVSVGHATSVITRISPANSTYQSFHQVIVDPSQLGPFLPPTSLQVAPVSHPPPPLPVPQTVSTITMPAQTPPTQETLQQEKSMPKNGKKKFVLFFKIHFQTKLL